MNSSAAEIQAFFPTPFDWTEEEYAQMESYENAKQQAWGEDVPDYVLANFDPRDALDQYIPPTEEELSLIRDICVEMVNEDDDFSPAAKAEFARECRAEQWQSMFRHYPEDYLEEDKTEDCETEDCVEDDKTEDCETEDSCDETENEPEDLSLTDSYESEDVSDSYSFDETESELEDSQPYTGGPDQAYVPRSGSGTTVPFNMTLRPRTDVSYLGFELPSDGESCYGYGDSDDFSSGTSEDDEDEDEDEDEADSASSDSDSTSESDEDEDEADSASSDSDSNSDFEPSDTDSGNDADDGKVVVRPIQRHALRRVLAAPGLVPAAVFLTNLPHAAAGALETVADTLQESHRMLVETMVRDLARKADIDAVVRDVNARSDLNGYWVLVAMVVMSAVLYFVTRVAK